MGRSSRKQPSASVMLRNPKNTMRGMRFRRLLRHRVESGFGSLGEKWTIAEDDRAPQSCLALLFTSLLSRCWSEGATRLTLDPETDTSNIIYEVGDETRCMHRMPSHLLHDLVECVRMSFSGSRPYRYRPPGIPTEVSLSLRPSVKGNRAVIDLTYPPRMHDQQNATS
jgi:hypothetical protein